MPDNFNKFFCGNKLVARFNEMRVDEKYAELECALLELGVSKASFSIGKPDIDEKYCFDLEDGFWWVYFSEKGSRSGVCVFQSYADAKSFFCCQLLSGMGRMSTSYF